MAICGPLRLEAAQTNFDRLYANNYTAAAAWADSVMCVMELEAKVGQLFMPIVMADSDGGWPEKIQSYIEKGFVGGLLFHKGSPGNQLAATQRAQECAAKSGQIPLWISADAEWGLSMRLSETMSFPRNTTLGAITDLSLLERMGQEMARECRCMGICVSFAPVADVNNNPRNPIINTRSFGSNPQRVAASAMALSKGMEQGGVLSVMKHFPGHGNTSEDSHEQLARVHNSRSGMDTVELYPFRYMIEHGVSGAMVGHLLVPALDARFNGPSSQSPLIVNGFLRDTLGFEGLVFTDALQMKGAAYSQSGMNCVRSLLAGNDVLLGPASFLSDHKAVCRAVREGMIPKSLIDEKCRKVLIYKYFLQQNAFHPLALEHWKEDLLTPEAIALNRQLFQEAVTLLRNEDDMLPLKDLDKKKTAVLLLGQPSQSSRDDSKVLQSMAYPNHTEAFAGETDAFARQLKLYQENVDVFRANGNVAALKSQLSRYDRIIVAAYANSGANREMLESLRSQAKKICLCLFTSPYSMSVFGSMLKECQAVLLAYEQSDFALQAAANAVFGGAPIHGVLPAPVGSYYAEGSGLKTPQTRLGYVFPEEVGLSSEKMAKIDHLVAEAIQEGAFPGCQVLVAKQGQVVWNKAYGYVDAWQSRPVRMEDMYDLASVTKSVGCTPSVMSLIDSKKIRLDDPISTWVTPLRGTDKAKLSYRNILYHQSGLPSSLPFYLSAIDPNSYNAKVFFSTRQDSVHNARFDQNTWAPSSFKYRSSCISSKRSDDYPKMVAEGMYLTSTFRDSVMKRVKAATLQSTKRYLYSDVGFVLMGMAVERASGTTLDAYVTKKFYAPLGAVTLGYLPMRRFGKERIVPTCVDTVLRRQVLQGYVHDETAAFMGGVSGNAGLFSSANDLAKYLQMLLNEGEYGGDRYIEAATVKTFTTSRSGISRRMLGFDAAEPDPDKTQTTCGRAPKSTYGHTGFTGTCFWVDPDNQLIYIFLSNRVHPDRTNPKLTEMSIRSRIHEYVYEAMKF